MIIEETQFAILFVSKYSTLYTRADHQSCGRITLTGQLQLQSAYKQKHFVSIDIEDTGIGLTVEEMHHIFDRFYRSDREEINQVGGIGLGLSIVQAIVQAYGGEISVDSKGEGEEESFLCAFLCAKSTRPA